MKKSILIIILCCAVSFLTLPVFAATSATNKNTLNNLHIIPEAVSWLDVTWAWEIVNKIWTSDWWKTTLIQRYNEAASWIDKEGDLGKAFQTGVMSRNTLLNYVVYLMRFLNQIGLLIWACMILYAGYLFATTIFGWDPNKGKNAIKNAIIGVLIIVFSYAIWKGLESMFL